MAALEGYSIGFIGIGLMGLPMARNLLQAGATLSVFTRSPEKAAPLIAQGAVQAGSPADLAARVGDAIIIICVNDTPALQAVFQGDAPENGLMGGLARGARVVDMGTSTVVATRALAEQAAGKGAAYVDAPVSGGVIGAEAGTLTIMAGGADEAVASVMPVLEVLGGKVTHIGPVGAGQVAKAVNQLIVGMTLDAVAEGLVLAKAAGADPMKVREALLAGFAGSRILDVHGGRMIERAFAPGGRAEIQLKDLRQALELAGQSGVVLPGLERAEELWAQMVERGHGGDDQAGIIQVIEALSAEASDAAV